jgi:hypothetical protein
MADAAVLDPDLHVMRAGVAPLKVEVAQWVVGAGGAVAFGWKHGVLQGCLNKREVTRAALRPARIGSENAGLCLHSFRFVVASFETGK